MAYHPPGCPKIRTIREEELLREVEKAHDVVSRANRVELAELLAKEQDKVAGLAQVEIDFTAV